MPETRGKDKGSQPAAPLTSTDLNWPTQRKWQRMQRAKAVMEKVLSNTPAFTSLAADKQELARKEISENMEVHSLYLLSFMDTIAEMYISISLLVLHADLLILTCFLLLFSDDYMDHTRPRTVYPNKQAVLNAINSVFYNNEDVFGIQWANTLFQIPEAAQDAGNADDDGDNAGGAGGDKGNKGDKGDKGNKKGESSK